ncbi:MAG: hypothetical protein IPP66_16855 [Anaerolineales bacterium]|nr:hypothetical protein [Anaerolineales bacterium]
MDKIKPVEKIASLYGISLESAKYFLGRVQKSFKIEKPPHTLIWEFIEAQGIDYLPEPYDIASLMYEGGIWVVPLNSPPPLLVDEEELDFEEDE